AIQKFERERKLPVTGQMSDRLVRELIAVTGRPIE
ncbi:MAG TPA: peptidoglycan-binding protein, partial [Bradyrhizobium sp.]